MFKKRTQKDPSVRKRVSRVQVPSSKVFSYYNTQRPVEVEDTEKKSARQTRNQQTAKKTTHTVLRRMCIGVLFFGLLGVMLYNTRLDPDKVQIILKGTPEERLLLKSTMEYKSETANIMRESLQNRTKLTFNGKLFSRALLERYPEVTNVQVSLPLIGSAATIYIEPSPAALLFVSQDKESFIVDINGRIIADANRNSLVDTPVITDQSGIQTKVGSQVLPANDVRSIRVIVSQLKEKDIVVESLVLPQAAQRLEVRLQGKPYYIKFNLHDAVLQQTGAYMAVQRKLDGEGVTPKEYIDVRVADRVYYR